MPPPTDTSSPGSSGRIVPCPTCGGDSLYAAANPYRPFCSARCRGIDLGHWASEEFRVPTEAPPEDDPFGDPRQQPPH